MQYLHVLSAELYCTICLLTNTGTASCPASRPASDSQLYRGILSWVPILKDYSFSQDLKIFLIRGNILRRADCIEDTFDRYDYTTDCTTIAGYRLHSLF